MGVIGVKGVGRIHVEAISSSEKTELRAVCLLYTSPSPRD